MTESSLNGVATPVLRISEESVKWGYDLLTAVDSGFDLAWHQSYLEAPS